MPPVITALYAGLNAIVNVLLAYRVTRLRGTHGVSIGDGAATPLQIGIRAHGNNAEFVPLALVMLLICELCGANHVAMHVFGGALLVARVLHPIGLPRKAPNVYRFVGVAITFATIVAASGYAIYLHFRLV